MSRTRAAELVMEAIAELEAAADPQSLLWAKHLREDLKTLHLLAQTEALR